MIRSFSIAVCLFALLSQPAIAQEQKKPSLTEAAGSVGGSVAGTVVGTTMGGPVGAVVGSTIGGAVGQGAGKVVHKVVHRKPKKTAGSDALEQTAVANAPTVQHQTPATSQSRTDPDGEPARPAAPPPNSERGDRPAPPTDDAPKPPPV